MHVLVPVGLGNPCCPSCQGEADTSTLVGRLHQSAHLPLKVLHSQDPWGHSHLQERPQASDLLVGEPPMEGTSGGPGMDRAMVLQEAEAEAEDAHQGTYHLRGGAFLSCARFLAFQLSSG